MKLFFDWMDSILVADGVEWAFVIAIMILLIWTVKEQRGNP